MGFKIEMFAFELYWLLCHARKKNGKENWFSALAAFEWKYKNSMECFYETYCVGEVN